MGHLIDAIAVAERTSFRRATVLNWAYGRKPAPHGFPRPAKVGNRLRWVEADVDAWIAGMSQTAAAPVPAPVALPPPPQRGRGRPRKMSRRLEVGVRK